MQIRNRLVLLTVSVAFSLACSGDEPPGNNSNNASSNNTSSNNSNNTSSNNSNNSSSNNSNNSNNSTNQEPVPEGALSWELPPAAREIEADEFSRRVDAGEILVVSQATLRERRDARQQQEVRDEQTIADFELRVSGVEFAFPADEPDTLAGDGNLRHEWQLPNGDPKEVTLHGAPWARHAVAEALRQYPTRSNQVALYKQMWTDFPVDIRNELQLPDPADVDASPNEYDVNAVRQFVETMSGYAAELTPDTFPIVPQPAGYPATCDDEVGAGSGTDRSGNCSPAPDGLYAAANWPTKWFNTCVKDQGHRGTCVAMSTVSSIEQMVAKRDRQWLNLSEQALYNRMKLQWEREDYWDGFFAGLAGSFLKDEGWHVPFETRWNYNQSTSRVDGVLACIEAYCVNSPWCESQCRDNAAWWYYLRSCDGYGGTCSDASHQSEMVCQQTPEGAYSCGFILPDQNEGGEGHGIADYGELWDHETPSMSMTRVLLNLAFERPVVIGIPLYDSFWDATANKGVVPMPDVANEQIRGAHAMHVLALVDNSTLPTVAPTLPDGAGGGYLIVKNSWGNCFGDGGYIYIPYDFIVRYVYDAVVFLGLQ